MAFSVARRDKITHHFHALLSCPDERACISQVRELTIQMSLKHLHALH